MQLKNMVERHKSGGGRLREDGMGDGEGVRASPAVGFGVDLPGPKRINALP